jgi:hypothetical protein
MGSSHLLLLPLLPPLLPLPPCHPPPTHTDDGKYEHPILDIILDHIDGDNKGYYLGGKWLRRDRDNEDGYRFFHHG